MIVFFLCFYIYIIFFIFTYKKLANNYCNIDLISTFYTTICDFAIFHLESFYSKRMANLKKTFLDSQ